MTVTGVTTAVLATNSYVPPFKSVFSPAPAVSVTGTVTSESKTPFTEADVKLDTWKA